MGMIRFTARMTSEVTREVEYEIDGDEIREWLGHGGEIEGGNIAEFIRAGRDRDEIEDAMWSQGHEVGSTAAAFAEIESIFGVTLDD